MVRIDALFASAQADRGHLKACSKAGTSSVPIFCKLGFCHLASAGPVDARHAYVDMSAVDVAASNWTRAGRTCSPAMGFSFAGGTTDGTALPGTT